MQTPLGLRFRYTLRIFLLDLPFMIQKWSIPVAVSRYRTDGKLLNLRRLQAKSKVKETTVRDLLFADDCALNASSEPEMQQSMNKFSSACDSFGLTISTKKTEVMFQPAPRKHLHWAIHHCQRCNPKSRGIFRLPRQHTLQICPHWQWSWCQNC